MHFQLLKMFIIIIIIMDFLQSTNKIRCRYRMLQNDLTAPSGGVVVVIVGLGGAVRVFCTLILASVQSVYILGWAPDEAFMLSYICLTTCIQNTRSSFWITNLDSNSLLVQNSFYILLFLYDNLKYIFLSAIIGSTCCLSSLHSSICKSFARTLTCRQHIQSGGFHQSPQGR